MIVAKICVYYHYLLLFIHSTQRFLVYSILLFIMLYIVKYVHEMHHFEFEKC